MAKIKKTLTLNQQKALSRAMSDKLMVYDQLIYIEEDHKNKIPIPISLVIKLSKLAMKKGDTKGLEKSYKILEWFEVAKSEYLRCGKNAIKNLDPANAVLAYQRAGTEIPEKLFLKMADTLLTYQQFDRGRWEKALKIYAFLNLIPPQNYLQGMLAVFKSDYMVREYLEVMALLKRPPEQEFLLSALARWSSQSDINALQVAYILTTLPEKVLTKDEFIELGQRAYAVGKIKDGDYFIERAFDTK